MEKEGYTNNIKKQHQSSHWELTNTEGHATSAYKKANCNGKKIKPGLWVEKTDLEGEKSKPSDEKSNLNEKKATCEQGKVI